MTNPQKKTSRVMSAACLISNTCTARTLALAGSARASVRVSNSQPPIPTYQLPHPQSNFPVTIAIFTSPIAFVILISRGQASVQLYAV